MVFRKNIDWVPCQNYGQAVGVSPGPPGQESQMASILLCSPTLTTGFSAAIAQPEANPVCTVQRILGQVMFGLSTTENPTAMQARLDVYERIHTVIYDFSNGDIASPSDSLTLATDANERYLWARQNCFDIGWALGGTEIFGNLFDTSQASPWFSAIDVKAKRRLEAGFALVYTATVRFSYAGGWTTPVTDLQFVFQPFIRCLARI